MCILILRYTVGKYTIQDKSLMTFCYLFEHLKLFTR